MRVCVPGAPVSAVPPVVEVVRQSGRLLTDRPVWVIARCPYCRHRHVHPADMTMRRMTIQAKCSTVRFYTVVEAAPVGAGTGQSG